MKTELNPSESAHLIELGIDPSKASENTEYGAWADSEHGRPIFTLSDILALIPRKIAFGHRTNCRFKIQAVVSTKDGLSEVWQACYLHTSRMVDYEAPELIDALYELLCWVLKNHSDKIKQL